MKRERWLILTFLPALVLLNAFVVINYTGLAYQPFSWIAFAQSYPPCVYSVITDLTAQNPNAVELLTVCFADIAYSYDPTTCAIQSKASDYCSQSCGNLIELAITYAYKYNCTTQTIAVLQQNSPFICEPGTKLCAAGQACVPLGQNATEFACLPIVNSTACNMTTLTQPCSACPYATICTVDAQNSNMPTCVQVVERTVDIITEPLNDAYFYLGQTYCQKYNNKYCSDYIYAVPEQLVACSAVDTWGCCGASYWDLEQHCQNPANDLIMKAHDMCPNSPTWKSKTCGGQSAAKCCAPVATPCNLNGAGGVLPSIFLVAIAQLAALYVARR